MASVAGAFSVLTLAVSRPVRPNPIIRRNNEMPNFKEHVQLGVATGGGIMAAGNAIRQWQRIQEDPNSRFDWASFAKSTLIGAAVGGVVASVPDLLEPAYHPNHRRAAHSVAALGACVYGCHRALQSSELAPEDRDLALTALLSYASHLAADSGTPKGLPFI